MKRYNSAYSITMSQSDCGDYVLYSDVEQLERENVALKSALDNQMKAVGELRQFLHNAKHRCASLEIRMDDVKKENECLREAVEGMLRISNLWIPTILPIEHQGEGAALHIARNKLIEALGGSYE